MCLEVYRGHRDEPDKARLLTLGMSHSHEAHAALSPLKGQVHPASAEASPGGWPFGEEASEGKSK